MNINLQSWLNLIAALAISMGGTTVIVIGLSKWFGDFLADLLLTKVKEKHEAQLEKIKSDLEINLEKTKAELDKAKAQFFRYSEKQYDTYTNLWGVLQQTKEQADMLWEQVNPEAVTAFAEQVKQTRKAIDGGALLIEKKHHTKLLMLITQFENYKIGKIQLKNIRPNQLTGQLPNITKSDVKSLIQENGQTKVSYDKLIEDIRDSFREQIRGN